MKKIKTTKRATSKNWKLVDEFVLYCLQHPEQRFWQALRNWSRASMIYMERPYKDYHRTVDTYYFKDKNE